MGVAATMTVEAQFTPGVWTDITADTYAAAGLTIKYGIFGSGPLDCVAGTGECAFALQNWATAGGRPQGYYSPLHASVRAGWTFGTAIRVNFVYAAVTYTKFRGKVGVIDPEPGLYGRQTVRVVAYDGMRDLASADVRNVALQIGASESTLISAVLDSLDVNTQPVARSIDAGIDTYPYAFYDVGGGEKALALVQKVCVNAFGLAAMKGDGTFIFRSRSTRATSASSYTFADTMQAMTAPSSLEQVYNIVRVTIHPKTIDSAATTVLWAATGTPLSIPAGQSITVWADYRDPANTTTLIGGTAVVNPLVAGTDYAGNAQADGLGANLTANLTVTVTPFASTAKVVIANTHASATVYLVDGAGAAKLQIRGKGVYDRGPQTYEASSTAGYGTQPLNIDLDYQSDASIAQSYATYVQAQYKSLSSRVLTLTVAANTSDPFMTQVLAREPGDIVTVSETVTGLSNIEAVISGIEIEARGGGPWVTCTWSMAPAAPFKSWILGVAGRTELGQTTILGF